MGLEYAAPTFPPRGRLGVLSVSRIIIPARFLLFHGFWDFLVAFHGKMHNISGYAKSYLTITGFYGIICGSGDF